MIMIQDGVQVYCLPDNAYCDADKEKRSPLDLGWNECPNGNDICSGECPHYKEEEKHNEEKNESRFLDGR